ncbi:IS21 family transposase [bacterium]|nr:IS21 family transposase [bacterium]
MGKNLTAAAARAEMDRKTARKYRDAGKLPSQLKKPHTWRTREDRIARFQDKIEGMLSNSFALEAKTIFEFLNRKYEGQLKESDLRTIQRRVKLWRVIDGPPREVMFQQLHRPGEQAQSDFTNMNSLGITIAGQLFEHMVYHFVLEYSNWEHVTICFSESFEALSTGLQESLWNLGATPARHRTDRFSAAINNHCNPEEFTARYQALVNHYGMQPTRNNRGVAHENGDVESSHGKFKKAVNQELLVRGSRDFSTREDYERFLSDILRRRNSLRRDKVQEELRLMNSLLANRLDDFVWVEARVSCFSTINVRHNIYSVDSRMIGEVAKVKVLSDSLEIWYGGKRLDRIPRLTGEGRHLINYRHVIDSLVRKPGAFANYCYREALFPNTTFRIAYDDLRMHHPATADRQYLKILHLAANESEQKVHASLDALIRRGERIAADTVEQVLKNEESPAIYQTHVEPVDLAGYDQLLSETEVA